MNQSKIGIAIAIVVLSNLFCACNSDKKTDEKVEIKESFKEKVAEEHMELLESACLYCHRLKPIEGEKEIAPLMQVTVDVYKAQYPKKEDFVKAFINFTIDPKAEKSLMQSAIDQYGLMPNSGIVKEDVEEIANYLYDYKF